MLRNKLSVAIALSTAVSASGQTTDFWFHQWNGPANQQDSISSIAHGPNGTVSAAGLSRSADGRRDFATVRYAADGTLLWSAVYGNISGYDDDARGLGVDAAGNTYTLGVSYNGNPVQGGTNYDYVLIKYAPDGTQLWLRRYDGPGHDEDQPIDMTVDAAGNCYIAGGAFFQPAPSGAFASDFHVMKYTSAGDIAWVYHTTSTAKLGAIAQAITLDPAGNVYATGYVIEPGANQDFLTVKLTNNGALVYRAQYSTSGFNTGDDEGLAITADAAGNAYVAGYWRPDVVQGQPDRHLDTLTLKYSPSGALLWTRSTTRPREDAATSIVVDDAGNVYVGGAWLAAVETDGWIESYSPNGAFRWQYILDEPETYDENWIVRLVMGPDGTLVAAADNERANGYDPTLLRFTTNGALSTRESFDAGSATDSCFAMDIDADGNVYFGGNSYLSPAGSDFLVMKVMSGTPRPGDVDGDGDVDLTDLSLLLASFGSCDGDATFDAAADLDQSGCVELSDLSLLLADFGA